MSEEKKIVSISDYNIYEFVIPNFRYRELHCKGCFQEGKKYFVRDESFLYRLGLLRKSLNLPIIVVSGVRCPLHNTKVGGHEKSGHLTGEAIDFYIRDYSVKEIYLKLEHYSFFSGVGLYPDERIRFIHIDTIDRIQRWVKRNGKYFYLF